MFKRNLFFYAPPSEGEGGSSAPSAEPAVQPTPGSSSETTDYKTLYDTLKADIDAGKKYISHARYAALQATLQKTVDEKTNFERDLTTTVAKVAELENLRDGLSTQLTGLTGEKTTLIQEKEKLASTLERHKLLMASYPELAQFEAQGLIPLAEDGKNEEIFKKFQEQLVNVGAKIKSEYGKGGGAPPPPTAGSNSAQLDAKALLAQATEKALLGKTSEYNSLMDQYYAKVANTT